MVIQHLSFSQIEAQINQLTASPQNQGVLESIVLRLPEERRATPQAAEVTPEGGLQGDRWGRAISPNSRAQISVINSRFLKIIAGDDERMSLAGDNLVVDLDLSDENLPTGTQLQIGGAIFEVTDLPHTGCQKFERRYGADTLKVVNADVYKSRRLRGLFIQVVRAGKIQVGDSISVLRKM